MKATYELMSQFAHIVKTFKNMEQFVQLVR